jgi:hypothetical protein
MNTPAVVASAHLEPERVPTPAASSNDAQRSSQPERFRASTAAQVIAEFVPDLPQRTREDLYALLGHELAAPTPAELREQQLGLLYELVKNAGGDWPNTDVYDAERKRRAERDEKWPAPSQLHRGYGSWAKACAAAQRLWEQGTHGRVPHTLQHAHFHYGRYQRKHVIAAIQRFRVALGHWPTQWEYEEWSRLQRRAARHTGQPDPKLPTPPRIVKLYGSWDRALVEAVEGW